LKDRIFGTECEYALFYQPDTKAGIGHSGGEDLLECLNGLNSLLVSCLWRKGFARAGEFLGNGGRFYIDHGGHPEYATPECRSVRELVAHEKAGDRIVQELVELARSFMMQRGQSGKLHIYKNNVDCFGNTYGGHENYLITQWAMEQIRAIVPFLVTRQIFAGAGKLMTRLDPQELIIPYCSTLLPDYGAGRKDKKKAMTTLSSGRFPYQLTQRADFIDRVANDRTSQERGIINIRKREIPQPGQNRRLHLIMGDSNMSEYALGLKIGTTGIVLRLLEEGVLNDVPKLDSPVEALKRISWSFDSLVRMEDRKGRYTALDVQYSYLERAERFFSSHKPSKEEGEILQLWSNTLRGLEKLKLSRTTGILEEDPEDLRRKIDWILKLWLLDRFREKNGLDWHDLALKYLDLRYHDLDPETGLFARCQELDLADRMVDEEEIHRAQIDPPEDTRAWTRSMIIRSTMNRNLEVHIKNWEEINIIATRKNPRVLECLDGGCHGMPNVFWINLQDPFQAQDLSVLQEVKRFVEIWG